MYWRIPIRVNPERLGDCQSILRRLEAQNCPVEQKGRLLVPEHNAVTDFYGVTTNRSFPVAQRVLDETLQVHAFPLYNGRAVEEVLNRFQAVANNGAL